MEDLDAAHFDISRVHLDPSITPHRPIPTLSYVLFREFTDEPQHCINITHLHLVDASFGSASPDHLQKRVDTICKGTEAPYIGNLLGGIGWHVWHFFVDISKFHPTK